VIAKDDARAACIKVLALWYEQRRVERWRFQLVHYQVIEAGFKYNMMDIQAAMGITS
jgi:dTDP-4-amino-4,6-dideoxygalactose transaminase